MAIKVTCPKCGKRASIGVNAAGRAARCPHCGNHFIASQASPALRPGQTTGVADAPAQAPADIRLPSVCLDHWEDIEDHLNRRRRDAEEPPHRVPDGTPDGNGGPSPVSPAWRGLGVEGLGIASVALGAVALPLSLLPGAGPLSLLLCGLGVSLGIAGIVSLARRRQGVAFPVTGVVVSALVAAAVGFLGLVAPAGDRPDGRRSARQAIHRDGEQGPKEGIAPPAQPEAKAPPGPTWVPQGQAAKLGDLQVQVARVTISRVPLRSTTPNATSRDPLLMVQVDLLNANPTRKVDYTSWASRDASATGGRATLTDNLGNTYKQIDFGPGSHPAGAVGGSASVYPDKPVSDVLAFEVPLKAATHLDLELPGRNCGAEGAARFRIPTSAVTQAAPGPVE